MDMTGEERIAASREVVWAALNDVAVLKQCIPGCESLEKTSDTDMAAKVKLQVGPVRAAFTGKVTLSDIDPPNGYRISGEGQGGVAGYAKGGAVVRLVDDSAGTLLKYEAKADVGGKLAQLGGRLIELDGQEARRRILPEVRRDRRGWVGRRLAFALPRSQGGVVPEIVAQAVWQIGTKRGGKPCRPQPQAREKSRSGTLIIRVRSRISTPATTKP